MTEHSATSAQAVPPPEPVAAASPTTDRFARYNNIVATSVRAFHVDPQDMIDLVAAYNALDKIRAAYIKCHEAPAHTAEDDAEAQLQLRLTVGHVLYPSTRTPAVGDPVYCVKDGPDYNKFGIVDSVSPAGDTIVILRPSGSRVVSTDDWKPLPGVPPQ